MKSLISSVVLLVSMIAGMVSCEGDGAAKNESPGMVVEEFYKLILDKEYEKAAQLYSNRGRKINDDETEKIEEMISWYADNYERKSGIKEVIIIEETIIGDHITAKVKYNIVFNNGDEDDKKQSLEKIDGKWYLLMLAR